MAIAAPIRSLSKLAQSLPLGEGEGGQGGPPATDVNVQYPNISPPPPANLPAAEPPAPPEVLESRTDPSSGMLLGPSTMQPGDIAPTDTYISPAEALLNPRLAEQLKKLQPTPPQNGQKPEPAKAIDPRVEEIKPEAQSAKPIDSRVEEIKPEKPIDSRVEEVQPEPLPPQPTTPMPSGTGAGVPQGLPEDPHALHQALVEQGLTPGQAQAVIKGQTPKTLNGNTPPPPKPKPEPSPAPQTEQQPEPAKPQLTAQETADADAYEKWNWTKQGNPPARLEEAYNKRAAIERGQQPPIEQPSTTTTAPAAPSATTDQPKTIEGGNIKGTATSFGLNYDGSWDRDDNGVGFFGGINTRNPKLKAVAVPVDVLEATFGHFVQKNADGTYSPLNTPEAKKIIQAIRSAHVEALGLDGKVHKFPIVDIQGSLKGHPGKVLDLTPAAGRELGFNDNHAVSYQIAGGDGKPYAIDPDQLAGWNTGGGDKGRRHKGGGGGGDTVEPNIPLAPSASSTAQQPWSPAGGGGSGGVNYDAPRGSSDSSFSLGLLAAAALKGKGGPEQQQPQQQQSPPPDDQQQTQQNPVVAAMMARGFTQAQAQQYAQSMQTVAPGKGIGPINVKGPPPPAPSQLSQPKLQFPSVKQLMPGKVPKIVPSGKPPPPAPGKPLQLPGPSAQQTPQQQVPQQQVPQRPPPAPAKPPSDLPVQQTPPAQQEPTQFTGTGRPAGSTHGNPTPPGHETISQWPRLAQQAEQHAAILSPDDPRVKKQKDGKIKGEHFVEGDPFHEQLWNNTRGGRQGRQRQIVGQAEQAIADTTPMHISYISSPAEAALYPTRESRTTQYEKHSPEARLMGTTTGQLVGHSFIPVSVGITPSKTSDPHESVIHGLSTNVLANNFQHLNQKLAEMGRKTPYKEFGAKFANDLEGYLSNLNAGHTGTGHGHAAGTAEYPNSPDEDHVPYKLTRLEADFINATINNTAAFAGHEDGQALRRLAQANGTLITEKGETNRLLHEIELQDPGWSGRGSGKRGRVLEPSIRTFKTGLIHDVHPSEEHMPQSIRPGKEYRTLTAAVHRTSQRGRPDIPISVSPRSQPTAGIRRDLAHNQKINIIEREFSEDRINEAQARKLLEAIGENPSEYQFHGGSGGLISPYEDDGEQLTAEEHNELKSNLRKQWISGKMPIEDYRRKVAEVPLPTKPSQKPLAQPKESTDEPESSPVSATPRLAQPRSATPSRSMPNPATSGPDPSKSASSPEPLAPPKPKPPKITVEPEPKSITPAQPEEKPETPPAAPTSPASAPKPKPEPKAPTEPVAKPEEATEETAPAKPKPPAPDEPLPAPVKKPEPAPEEETPPPSASHYVSPNVKEGTDLEGALKQVQSQPHKKARDFYQRVEDAYRPEGGGKVTPTIGNWEGTREGSSWTHDDKDNLQDARVKAAIKGLHSAQKGTAVFHHHDDGPDLHYDIDFPEHSHEEADKLIAKHGFSASTIHKTKEGLRAHLIDPGGENHEHAKQLAAEAKSKSPVIRQGTAAFDGGDDRDSAAEAYRRVLRGSGIQIREGQGGVSLRGYGTRRQHPLQPLYEEAEDNFAKHQKAITRQAEKAQEEEEEKEQEEVMRQAAADREDISPERQAGMIRLNKKAKAVAKQEGGVEGINPLSMHAHLTGQRTFPGKLKNEHIGEYYDANNPRLDYANEEHREHVSHAVYHDIVHALAGTTTGGKPSTAYGWYNDTVKKSLKKAGEIAPKILTHADHALAFKLAWAITSQGQDVFPNTESTWAAYRYFHEHGRLPESREIFGGGLKAEQMEENFKKINKLWHGDENQKGLGHEALEKRLMKQMTVGELEKKFGMKVPGELKHHKVNGAMFMGAKIGAFFSNLNGDFDPTTMDLWFSRNMNLMAGNMFGFSDEATRVDRMEKGKLVKSHLNQLKEVLDSGMLTSVDPDKARKMSDEISALMAHPQGQLDRPTARKLAPEIYDWARERHNFYQQSSGLKGSYNKELKTPENTAAKKLDLGVSDLSNAPRNGTEREWWRDIMRRSGEKLKAVGLKLVNADKQALLWFVIKDLFRMAGSPQRDKADYLDAAHMLVHKVKKGKLPGLPVENQEKAA